MSKAGNARTKRVLHDTEKEQGKSRKRDLSRDNLRLNPSEMSGKIKVLNLYAGIGGNRKLWPNDKIEVTAVEINLKIAEIYQKFFPNDKIVVADAHQYLLDHFNEFDFIWSSPPCPTHSGCNNFLFAPEELECLKDGLKTSLNLTSLFGECKDCKALLKKLEGLNV